MSSLNQTPSAGRLHISFFGCRNAGKSSIVNAVTGQELSIVSDIKGTTTDPVTKSMSPTNSFTHGDQNMITLTIPKLWTVPWREALMM